MAHYAFLDENNIVTEVIVGIDETETIDGLDPEVWYANFRGQACKRTSYNTSAGQHIFSGTPYRKNYAGIGFTYDENRDAFIPPKPFDSWILNEDTCLWESPVPYPDMDNIPEHYRNYTKYIWDDDILKWELVCYFNSWILREDGYYEAPIPYPTDGGIYEWDDLDSMWINTQTNID